MSRMPKYGTPAWHDYQLRDQVMRAIHGARAFGKDRPYFLGELKRLGFATEAAAEKFLRTRPVRATEYEPD